MSVSTAKPSASVKSARSPKVNGLSFLRDLNALERNTLIGASLLGFGLLTSLLWSQMNQHWLPHRLTLAAGRSTGESYILSEALARVVKAHSNLTLDVCTTDGTDDNIRALQGKELTNLARCQSGLESKTLRAQIITAQADRLPGATSRSIATLYEDKFQLLVDPRKIPLSGDLALFNIAALNGKIIDTPVGGGQRASFESVANHFKLGFKFLDSDAKIEQRITQSDAIFRVRAVGNQEIRKLIQQYKWQLVPIDQAAAMQSTKHPAYVPSTIPKGAYQGSPPVPAIDINTISVRRSLLMDESVPDWMVETVTRILNEHRQELRDAIDAIAKERSQSQPDRDFDPETVKPLVDAIKRPPADDSVQMHRGALNFYERDRPSFIQENADYLALILTIVLLLGSWFLELKSWHERRKHEEQEQIRQVLRERANTYIEAVVNSMGAKGKAINTPLTIQQLIRSLEERSQQQDEINQVFTAASNSLEKGEISQEGFRAFSEAYKSARDVIERTIEDDQRRFSAYYVGRLMTWLDRLNQGENVKTVAAALNQLLKEASEILVKEQVFSRESFQTFTEAYELVQDAVDRRNRGPDPATW